MAQQEAANQRWNRTEGFIFSSHPQAEQIESILRELNVLARLEWYPRSEHQLGVVVLTDTEGRVAVTPPSRGGVVPGMSVSELVEDLAKRAGLMVTIGPATFDALPAGTELPGIDDATEAGSRTVVISPLSAYTVPLQATLLERSLAVASVPGLDRRVVMYEGEGLELGTFGWDEDSLPAVVLSATADELAVHAIVSGDEDEDVRFSWAMVSSYVWGGVDEPGPALRNLADELLADSTDAQILADAVPGADVEDVKAALEMGGEEGLAAMVTALGLPEWVEQVLTGTLAMTEVPGVVLHEPRGLSNAVGRSVGLMLNDPSMPGSSAWNWYVRTVTDTPWMLRTASALEAGLGGALIGAAIRRRRHTGTIPASWVTAGVFMVVDAISEASLASWTRHRELRRRADEEMALVAEELGA